MKKVVFDIETNMKPKDEWDKSVFLNNVVSLACLCIIDLDTGDKFTYHDNEDLARDGTNEEGVQKLLEADLLIGHNIKAFDIPALNKLYPEYAPAMRTAILGDTLGSCRAYYSWSYLKDWDKKHNVQHNEYNAKALNSLGAWGDRFLALGKVDLAKDDEYKASVDWSNITIDQELIDYCMQDVVVNIEVYKYLRLERNMK